MMQRWSNDRWVSTLHRVVVPELGDSGSRRLSLGYFVHPDYDADIACIPTCLAPGEVPRYEPLTAVGPIAGNIARSHQEASGFPSLPGAPRRPAAIAPTRPA